MPVIDSVTLNVTSQNLFAPVSLLQNSGRQFAKVQNSLLCSLRSQQHQPCCHCEHHITSHRIALESRERFPSAGSDAKRVAVRGPAPAELCHRSTGAVLMGMRRGVEQGSTLSCIHLPLRMLKDADQLEMPFWSCRRALVSGGIGTVSAHG